MEAILSILKLVTPVAAEVLDRAYKGRKPTKDDTMIILMAMNYENHQKISETIGQLSEIAQQNSLKLDQLLARPR